MKLQLRDYLINIRGYSNVSSFPVEEFGIRFDIGFINHLGEKSFIRVIPEVFFKVDSNPAVKAIKDALIEMNRLVEKSENQYHFCIALADNDANKEIVKQNSDLLQENVGVYFVNDFTVIESSQFFIKDCDCEDDDGFFS